MAFCVWFCYCIVCLIFGELFRYILFNILHFPVCLCCVLFAALCFGLSVCFVYLLVCWVVFLLVWLFDLLFDLLID